MNEQLNDTTEDSHKETPNNQPADEDSRILEEALSAEDELYPKSKENFSFSFIANFLAVLAMFSVIFILQHVSKDEITDTAGVAIEKPREAWVPKPATVDLKESESKDANKDETQAQVAGEPAVKVVPVKVSKPKASKSSTTASPSEFRTISVEILDSEDARKGYLASNKVAPSTPKVHKVREPRSTRSDIIQDDFIPFEKK